MYARERVGEGHTCQTSHLAFLLLLVFAFRLPPPAIVITHPFIPISDRRDSQFVDYSHPLVRTRVLFSVPLLCPQWGRRSSHLVVPQRNAVKPHAGAELSTHPLPFASSPVRPHRTY
jgi:hypothetical protein